MTDLPPPHYPRPYDTGLNPNRPVYRREMQGEAFDAFVENCMLGMGCYVLSLPDLIDLHRRLKDTPDFLTNIETFEPQEKYLFLEIPFSVIGLDGEDDWPEDERPERFRALVDEQIAAMEKSGKNFIFCVWV